MARKVGSITSRPSSRPIVERVRHAEAVEQPDVNGHAFRPGWLVLSRLDGLFIGKVIDRAVYDAALGVARDHELAAGTDGSPFARVGMPSTGWRDPIASRIDAAARLQLIRQRIGGEAYALVIAVVAEDRSWREIGRPAGCAGRHREERRCRCTGSLGRAALKVSHEFPTSVLPMLPIAVTIRLTC